MNVPHSPARFPLLRIVQAAAIAVVLTMIAVATASAATTATPPRKEPRKTLADVDSKASTQKLDQALWVGGLEVATDVIFSE